MAAYIQHSAEKGQRTILHSVINTVYKTHKSYTTFVGYNAVVDDDVAFILVGNIPSKWWVNYFIVINLHLTPGSFVE